MKLYEVVFSFSPDPTSVFNGKGCLLVSISG